MYKFIDMHCDTISELYAKKTKGEAYSLYQNDLDIDIKRLQKGGAYVQCFAMFTHLPSVDSPFEYANSLIDLYYEEIKKNKNYITPVFSYEDIKKAGESGKIGALLTLEEGECCEGSVEKLKHFYDRGARMMNITWNFKNSLGYPNIIDPNNRGLQADTVNGLTQLGKEFVCEMQSLGMIVDTSHSSDKSFYDVSDIVKGPFIASHSNCRSICGHPRNLTDDMIRVLAEHGGVAGLNYCPAFIKENADYISAEDFVPHVLHFIKTGGEDCVGLGTDYDGINSSKLQVRDPSFIGLLIDQLKKSGITERVIDKILYKNVERVFEDILK